MLFQPIVVNHWYFMRHLKRWMICANEISIIYGKLERDSTYFSSEPMRKKNYLRFVFIVYYGVVESFWVCLVVFAERENELGAFVKRDWKCRSLLRKREWKAPRWQRNAVSFIQSLTTTKDGRLEIFRIRELSRRIKWKKISTHIQNVFVSPKTKT